MYLFIISIYSSNIDMPNCFNEMFLIDVINKILTLEQVIFCRLLVNQNNVLYIVFIFNCQKISCITNLQAWVHS